MSTEYGVQAANFSEQIHVGRLNARGDAFADKQERTDMVLAAVAQYVAQNFGGGMIADFPGLGLLLEIKVTAATPTHTTEAHDAPEAS